MQMRGTFMVISNKKLDMGSKRLYHIWYSDYSNQIQFDSLQTANNSTFVDWSKSYFAIPYTIVTTATNSALVGDSIYRLAVAFKSSFIDIINSSRVQLNDVNIVNTNPNANALTNLRLLLEMDTSKQEQIGDILDWYTNDMRVDPANVGSMINNAIPSVPSAISGLPTYNSGFTRRIADISNPAWYNNNGALNGSGTRNQVYLVSGSATGVIGVVQDAYIYYGEAIIRASDVHDCFRQMDFPAKNCRWIIYLNTNTNSAGQCIPLMVSAAANASSTASAPGLVAGYSATTGLGGGNNVSLNNQSLFIGSSPTNIAFGAVINGVTIGSNIYGPSIYVPVVAATLTLGADVIVNDVNTYTLTSPSLTFTPTMIGATVRDLTGTARAAAAPNTLTIISYTSPNVVVVSSPSALMGGLTVIGGSILSINPSTITASAPFGTAYVAGIPGSNPFGNTCRWYYPKIDLHPELERKMIGSDLKRIVPYYDWNFFKYTTQSLPTPGQITNVNWNPFPGIPNVTKLVIIPVASGSAISPLTIEPDGTTPLLTLQNITIMVNGQNYFLNSINQKYDYEQYMQNTLPEFMGGFSHNSLCSGLLSYSAWENRGRFYVFDISRNPGIVSPDVPVGIQLMCQTDYSGLFELWLFCLTESAFQIDQNASGTSMVRSLPTSKAAEYV
jgi:hypothetical protein